MRRHMNIRRRRRRRQKCIYLKLLAKEGELVSSHWESTMNLRRSKRSLVDPRLLQTHTIRSIPYTLLYKFFIGNKINSFIRLDVKETVVKGNCRELHFPFRQLCASMYVAVSKNNIISREYDKVLCCSPDVHKENKCKTANGAKEVCHNNNNFYFHDNMKYRCSYIY